jgi:putative transposase
MVIIHIRWIIITQKARFETSPLWDGFDSMNRADKQNNNNLSFSPENMRAKIIEFCRFVKKCIYPEIPFKSHHNAKYSDEILLDALTHVAMTHDFTENGSRTFKSIRGDSPDAETIMYRIKKFDEDEEYIIFDRILEKILQTAKSYNLFKRSMDVAIDITDNPYYGNKDDYMVCGTKPNRGTRYAYKYATVNIVVAGKRFTLAVFTINRSAFSDELVKGLIEETQKIVKIRYVFLDRWFFTIGVIRFLKRSGIKFLMPARRTPKISKLIRRIKPPRFFVHMLGDRYQGFETTFLYLVNDEWGKQRLFATNIFLPEENAGKFFDMYGRRWGIETSYRVKNVFRSRTTSKNYKIRYFYFMFSVCLYNLWVLVNAFIGLFFGRDFKKPLITAKMFGTLLYSFVIEPP